LTGARPVGSTWKEALAESGKEEILIAVPHLIAAPQRQCAKQSML
jgi:hypothetical protein